MNEIADATGRDVSAVAAVYNRPIFKGIAMVFGSVPTRRITMELLLARAKVRRVEFKFTALAELIYGLGPDCPDMACLLEDCGDHWKARPDLHVAEKATAK